MTAEFQALRAANLALFSSFDGAAQDRLGTASDHPLRVSAIPWILAGHELHHVKVLRKTYAT